MSSEEIEKHVRDHDEAIRNLERVTAEFAKNTEKTNAETLAAIQSFHKRMSKSQEYQLRDNRINTEETKLALKEAIREAAVIQAEKCSTHEVRLKAVEDKNADLEKYATKAENNIYWLDRWALGLTAVLFSFLGWDTYKGLKP